MLIEGIIARKFTAIPIAHAKPQVLIKIAIRQQPRSQDRERSDVQMRSELTIAVINVSCPDERTQEVEPIPVIYLVKEVDLRPDIGARISDRNTPPQSVSTIAMIALLIAPATTDGADLLCRSVVSTPLSHIKRLELVGRGPRNLDFETKPSSDRFDTGDPAQARATEYGGPETHPATSSGRIPATCEERPRNSCPPEYSAFSCGNLQATLSHRVPFALQTDTVGPIETLLSSLTIGRLLLNLLLIFHFGAPPPDHTSAAADRGSDRGPFAGISRNRPSDGA
jgi:hypothetical protein